MLSAWEEALKTRLTDNLKNKQGEALFAKYAPVFSEEYKSDHEAQAVVNDIMHMEILSLSHPLRIDFYKDEEAHFLHIRIYKYGEFIPLSDILPLFDNFDLKTYSERSYDIHLEHTIIWISDFTVSYVKFNTLNIDAVKFNFAEAFIKIYEGDLENDGFNKLILGAGLTFQEIIIIRAYTKYLLQTVFRFSQSYIEKTVATYPDIVKDLVQLFKLRHNPDLLKKDNEVLEANIQKALAAILNLDDDKIMRRFLQLIKATVRTNYFQNKPYLSFKLRSEEVPELPLPHPLFEIFVYSPRFEGIHLRSAKVARGGIRWSDRREDFRTEILGLMKAQKVKNAVIVPSGAKGGFILKVLNATTSEIMQKEVIDCYSNFIRGLLDLTDNIKAGKIIPPPNLYCYDEEDPYLVVAADKGTATFSDIANDIAKEYDFWLGDAFASGGSKGYDHKKIGITARGAWESIRRHFQELNRNIDSECIRVVGIGDMSGDVFGNGLIYSKNLQLIAAFDHRHIFLDPSPDSEESFKERLRLFNLPRSSWEDYNINLISKGGGIYKRSAKSIPLSKEVQVSLGIEASELTPNELIKAILKAPVDLLFNGGIGTYVKASYESHAEVGDKINEFCRVNGGELRAQVVGEGGNLGFTQLGRVEYALQGGLINTDFIDNSAGVDCSDHEVNIKILLHQAMASNSLTQKDRDALLLKMTEEVASLVLQDNYEQALAMSFSSVRARHYVELHQAYINDLEQTKVLDRTVEFLPSNKVMQERKMAGLGLTRPEIAVLLAYTKINIKNEILKTHLPEEAYFKESITAAFPAVLAKKYETYMLQHTLHREIIATILSNRLVNEMGVTFVYRVQTETGASVAEIIRAHAISARIFKSNALEKIIESLSGKIAITLQYELLHYVRLLLNLSTRWFLRSRYLKEDLLTTIHHFEDQIEKLKTLVPELMTGKTREFLDSLANHFIEAGLDKELAQRIAVYRALYTSLNIIEVATHHQFDLVQTAKIYFLVGSKFNLVWFRDQISLDNKEGHWPTMARLALRDELDILQRFITTVIMKNTEVLENPELTINNWIRSHHRPIERWEKLLQLLHANNNIDYTMFFVALRELSDWVYASAL